MEVQYTLEAYALQLKNVPRWVCKVFDTVRRGGVSPPDCETHAGERTAPLRCLRFPSVRESLLTKYLHTPHRVSMIEIQ